MALRQAIHISEEEKKILRRKIAERLLSSEQIVFAYVFGSFGAGDFRDIDVAVFVSDTGGKKPLELEMELESALETLTSMPVDVRVINHAPLTFVYNVLKGGEVLVDKDPSLRADFEGRLCKEYFDFRHLREEYLREIAHAPV